MATPEVLQGRALAYRENLADPEDTLAITLDDWADLTLADLVSTATPGTAESLASTTPGTAESLASSSSSATSESLASSTSSATQETLVS